MNLTARRSASPKAPSLRLEAGLSDRRQRLRFRRMPGLARQTEEDHAAHSGLRQVNTHGRDVFACRLHFRSRNEPIHVPRCKELVQFRRTYATRRTGITAKAAERERICSARVMETTRKSALSLARINFSLNILRASKNPDQLKKHLIRGYPANSCGRDYPPTAHCDLEAYWRPPRLLLTERMPSLPRQHRIRFCLNTSCSRRGCVDDNRQPF
jgi:hypothetical protein